MFFVNFPHKARQLVIFWDGIKAHGTHGAKAYHLAKVLMLTESKDRFLDCLKRLQEEKGTFDSTNETSSKNWRNIF